MGKRLVVAAIQFVDKLMGEGVLLSNRLMEVCRWMGSHSHGWIAYNGTTFSTKLLETGQAFSGFSKLENSDKWRLSNEKIRGEKVVTVLNSLYQMYHFVLG